MPKPFIFTFIFLSTFSLFAETIVGNCEIMDKPFGASQFQLEPGTIVSCSITQKGWCMVVYKAFVDKKFVYDGIKVLKNARLKSGKGKNVGRVFVDFNPIKTIDENDTCFVMEIAGYIEVSCIEDTSVVEHSLEKLYQRKDSLLSISLLNAHLREFNYTQWVSRESMYSFLLMETDIVNTKPGLRMAIIFDNNKVVAILHKRSLHIKSFESAIQSEKYSLIYLGSFNESYKKKIADTFLYAADELY